MFKKWVQIHWSFLFCESTFPFFNQYKFILLLVQKHTVLVLLSDKKCVCCVSWILLYFSIRCDKTNETSQQNTKVRSSNNRHCLLHSKVSFVKFHCHKQKCMKLQLPVICIKFPQKAYSKRINCVIQKNLLFCCIFQIALPLLLNHQYVFIQLMCWRRNCLFLCSVQRTLFRDYNSHCVACCCCCCCCYSRIDQMDWKR